jgi:poly-beta-hydroxyalkanoate depolymerase
MAEAIKARYRESGSKEISASTILFEITVSIDEKDRETRENSNELAVISSTTWSANTMILLVPTPKKSWIRRVLDIRAASSPTRCQSSSGLARGVPVRRI